MKIGAKKIINVFKKVKINKFLLIGVLIFSLIGGAVVFFFAQIKQIKLFGNQSRVEDQITQLQEQIRLLSQNNTTTTKSDDLNTTKELQSRIKELTEKPKQQLVVSGSSTVEYSSFIPYVVQISCSDKSGSGTIISPNTILTNYHVVSGNINCLIGFTTDAHSAPSEWVTGTVKSINPKTDRAIISVSHNLANKTINKCDVSKVMPGDELVVLGYPGIGGSTITLTNGIVSGFYENYIKTSAKIDHGNSGGAAIHKAGCFLGIPTLAKLGEVESLGLIINEMVGSGTDKEMQSVDNDQEYQQEIIEKQQMDEAKIKDKEYYDGFVWGYNKIMEGHLNNKTELNNAINFIYNQEFDSAVSLLDASKISANFSSYNTYLNNFYNFSIFNNILIFKNELSGLFSNMFCTMDTLRDYSVYRKVKNYTSADSKFNEFTECYKQLLLSEDNVKILFNSINNTASKYFNE